MNDWDAYRVFAAVVERGSFSRAAAELGISQPTASRRVDDLERALGARLLVRRARGVVPTPAGERVASEVRRMAQAAVLAGAAASGGATGPRRRRVRISATEGFGAVWLPHRVPELREGHPELAIEIVVDNAASDLAARQADLAVRLFRPRQADLVAKRVGSVGFGLYASRAYLAARGTPRRLADLARHDHVGFIPTALALPAYMRWLRGLVPEDRFVASASSLLAMTELARAGTGIVLNTAAFAAGDARLVRVLPRATPPPLDIWLAVHADVRRDPDVVLVMDRLAAALAREAAVLSDRRA